LDLLRKEKAIHLFNAEMVPSSLGLISSQTLQNTVEMGAVIMSPRFSLFFGGRRDVELSLSPKDKRDQPDFYQEKSVMVVHQCKCVKVPLTRRHT